MDWFCLLLFKIYVRLTGVTADLFSQLRSVAYSLNIDWKWWKMPRLWMYAKGHRSLRWRQLRRMHQFCGIRTLRSSSSEERRAYAGTGWELNRLTFENNSTSVLGVARAMRGQGWSWACETQIGNPWNWTHLVAKERLTFFSKRLKDERPCRCWLCKNTNSRGNSMKMKPFDGCKRTGTVALMHDKYAGP